MKTLNRFHSAARAFVLGLFPVCAFASPAAEPSPEPSEVVIAMASTESIPSPTSEAHTKRKARPLKPLDTKPAPFPSAHPMDRNPGSLPPIPVPDRPKPEAPEPSASDTVENTRVQ